VNLCFQAPDLAAVGFGSQLLAEQVQSAVQLCGEPLSALSVGGQSIVVLTTDAI
jgi:hypothetical protein